MKSVQLFCSILGCIYARVLVRLILGGGRGRESWGFFFTPCVVPATRVLFFADASTLIGASCFLPLTLLSKRTRALYYNKRIHPHHNLLCKLSFILSCASVRPSIILYLGAHDLGGRRGPGGVHHGQGRAVGGGHQGHLHGVGAAGAQRTSDEGMCVFCVLCFAPRRIHMYIGSNLCLICVCVRIVHGYARMCLFHICQCFLCFAPRRACEEYIGSKSL